MCNINKTCKRALLRGVLLLAATSRNFTTKGTLLFHQSLVAERAFVSFGLHVRSPLILARHDEFAQAARVKSFPVHRSCCGSCRLITSSIAGTASTSQRVLKIRWKGHVDVDSILRCNPGQDFCADTLIKVLLRRRCCSTSCLHRQACVHDETKEWYLSQRCC